MFLISWNNKKCLELILIYCTDIYLYVPPIAVFVCDGAQRFIFQASVFQPLSSNFYFFKTFQGFFSKD